MDETIYTEKGAILPLLEGKTVKVRGIGNSMTPLIKSHQVCLVVPVIHLSTLRKNDIVLCKVKGNIYMHKVTGIRKDQVQISNNHGRVNGWTSLVYGRIIRVIE